MEHLAAHMFAATLQTIVLIAVPVVAAVAVAGVITGVIQTIVQVQDQNVAYLPKLLVVVALIALAGSAALRLLEQLLHSAAEALPRLLGL
ncbi:MAG: flagellar biosynthetic protein FliQ [Candidatus Eremiobacteraeota bacterium]|nr:flagellar biosynthetic protein FliQ [Candidatus Eremiobacteraeota bacterium]